MADGARPYAISVDQIADMMRSRIRELCAEWRLVGQVEHHDFVALSPLRADRSPGSFRVALAGQYKGLVRDFATDESWSPLSFTAALWFNGDNVRAIQWAKGWLGLDGTDPSSLQKTRHAVARAAKADDAIDVENDKRRQWAFRIWLSADEQIRGTPVEHYLAGRGIELKRLPFNVGSLRFHPSLFNSESNREWPAMVATIIGPDGKFRAVHRTWLAPDPKGGWHKAPLTEAKRTLGPYRGGFISIWKGIRVDPGTGEIVKAPAISRAPAPIVIDVTEGIEDALSVAIAMPELRVIAAVSLSNIGNLKFPRQVEELAIWAQNDGAGSPAELALERAIAKLQQTGLRVVIARPPSGVKDVNEILQEGAA